MGINNGRFRNLILIFLVILSFFLSFTLWTAGRNVGEEESTSGQTSRSRVSLVTHSASEVFRPTIVALHGMSDEEPLLIGSTYQLRNFLNARLETANLAQIERSELVNYEDYIEDLQTGRWIEFVYSEELPIGTVSQKFDEISQDTANIFFNRVVVDLDSRDAVYFYHTDSQSIYVAPLLEGEVIELDPFLNRGNLTYVAADPIVLENNVVYVPKESLEIPYRGYVINQLANSTYISNFFPDTSVVDVRSTETLTRYIDLTKEVTINDTNHTLTYLRQIHGSDDISPVERYRRSFEQINRFENWSDTFMLSSYDREDQIISFRREIEGVPVFSEQEHESVSEIALVESGVTHLKVPLRFVNTPITIPDSPTKQLISGVKMLEQIKNSISEENFEKIEDITVGYAWQESEEESQVIYFNPDWYILYNDDWMTHSSLLKLQEVAADGL